MKLQTLFLDAGEHCETHRHSTVRCAGWALQDGREPPHIGCIQPVRGGETRQAEDYLRSTSLRTMGEDPFTANRAK
jgi:hypothetical protein